MIVFSAGRVNEPTAGVERLGRCPTSPLVLLLLCRLVDPAQSIDSLRNAGYPDKPAGKGPDRGLAEAHQIWKFKRKDIPHLLVAAHAFPL